MDVPPASAVAGLLCKPVDDPPLGCVDFPGLLPSLICVGDPDRFPVV